MRYLITGQQEEMRSLEQAKCKAEHLASKNPQVTYKVCAVLATCRAEIEVTVCDTTEEAPTPYCTASGMPLNHGKPWTRAQEDALRCYWRNDCYTIRDIARHMRRTVRAIELKLRDMGLMVY